MRKLISAILAVLVMVPMIASCSDDSVKTNENEAVSVTEAVKAESEKLGVDRANLPDMKLDGEDFIFLGGGNDGSGWTWQYLDVEVQDGEVLNDAIYKRNRKIEKLYDVNISAQVFGITADQTIITNSINADDNSFDALHWRADMLLALSRDNYLVDFYDMPYIDTTATWWDQSVVEGLTLCDQLYTCTGDISCYTNARVYAVVFNKDMCRELGLELPYANVFDGSWTLDRFNYYISNVNSDINGDSKMDYDDRWGFFSQNGGGTFLYFAAGGRVSETVGGEMKITFNNERNVQTANTTIGISIDETKTLMANPLVSSKGSWQAASDWFANGGSLMRASVFEPVPRDYRSMETDFGVLPFPKLDENQKNYYTLPESGSVMIAFPTTCDREFTGLIVEALAAESTHTVKEAFYENCLNEKSVRDEDSKKILQIIFDNKVFDFGYMINLGDAVGQLGQLEANKNTNVASTFEKISKAAQKELEKLIEDYEALAAAE